MLSTADPYTTAGTGFVRKVKSGNGTHEDVQRAAMMLCMLRPHDGIREYWGADFEDFRKLCRVKCVGNTRFFIHFRTRLSWLLKI